MTNDEYSSAMLRSLMLIVSTAIALFAADAPAVQSLSDDEHGLSAKILADWAVEQRVDVALSARSPAPTMTKAAGAEAIAAAERGRAALTMVVEPTTATDAHAYADACVE